MRIAMSAAWPAGENVRMVRSSATAVRSSSSHAVLIEGSFSTPMNKTTFHKRDRAFEQEADDADDDQAHIDVLDPKEGRGVHDHVTQPPLRGDEFGSDNQRPANGRGQSEAHHDLWQGRRKHHVQEGFSV